MNTCEGGTMESRIETTLLTEEPPVSSDFIDTLVEQRVGPGILMLSPALKLMHMNRRAWEVSRKITPGEDRKAATGGPPPAAPPLCRQDVPAFPVRTKAKCWGHGQPHPF